MLKLFLCAAAVGLCVLFSYLLTRRFRLRKDFFTSWHRFNERLINEVSYTRVPLPAFLEKYRFTGDFGRMLEEKKDVGFGEIGCAFAYLSEDERRAASDYFRMVGRSDAASQRAYLAAARGEIGSLVRAADEEYKKTFSLYIKLGVLAGLVLVILIV